MEISPIYHNSRPEGELPAQETAAFDFLDSLGIDYERVTHELADTMEKCDDVSAILGLMNDDENRVQLLIDKETYEAEYFSCHPCLCTSTIKLKTSDVKNMLLPKVHHEPIVVEL